MPAQAQESSQIPDAPLQGAETQAIVAQPDLPVDGEYVWGGYLQAIGAMGLVLVALWLLLRLIKNMNRKRLGGLGPVLSREDFYLEGQLPLGQNRGLFVVRFLNKRLVLGVTDQHINLISEAEAKADENIPSSFQQVMAATQLADPDSAAGRFTGNAGPAQPGSGPD